MGALRTIYRYCLATRDGKPTIALQPVGAEPYRSSNHTLQREDSLVSGEERNGFVPTGPEERENPLVRVEHLVKHFPIQGSDSVVSAVSDVSFEIRAGETLGLVGRAVRARPPWGAAC